MNIMTHLKQIKKSVCYVYIKDDKGKYHINGTGFFIGFKKRDSDFYYTFFITAKHVLEKEDNNLVESFAIRLNKRDGVTSELLELDKPEYFVHSDGDVDLVLINYLPDQTVYDFLFISNELISDKKIISDKEIGEGDEVFFAGLFTSHIGKKNQPIVRFGKVALIPEEKVVWQEKDKPLKYLELYLMECFSFGGNSGSPVFFQLNNNRNISKITIGKPPEIFLAGVIKGMFNSTTPTNIEKLFSADNIGISAITPAYYIKEIFNEIAKLKGLHVES